MKSWILAIAFLGSINAGAQKIEKFFTYDWKETVASKARFYALIEREDNLWHRRDYFIHEQKMQMDGYYTDSSCKIPEGQFYYFHPNGKPESVGKYHLGERTGVWLSYHSNGMMNDSVTYKEGYPVGTNLGWHPNGFISDSAVWNDDGSGVVITWFDNGNAFSAGRYVEHTKRHGAWQFFHRNGALSAKIVYNKGSIVTENYFNEESQPVDRPLTDKPATFPGGLNAWRKFMLKHIYFPDRYKITGSDEAVVVVDAVIDEEGNVTDIVVSTPFYPEFDQIAVDMMKRSPRWDPAISFNRKVRYRIRQAVRFTQSADD